MTERTRRNPNHPDWRHKSKGPGGRGLCKWCLAEVPANRRTRCSAECERNLELLGNSNYVRDMVWQRDKGRCALCLKIKTVTRRSWTSAKTYEVPQWEADHIVPLCEGGSHELKNVRTLCIPCHRSETALLRKRLANSKETIMPNPESEIQTPCPECGKPMLLRTNRQTGVPFLGCRQFPQCAGTLPEPEYFRMKRAGAPQLPGLDDL